MQPSPILFLTGDAADRQATFEARQLERRRMIVEAKRDASPRGITASPMRAGVGHRLRALGHLVAGRRRGATGTGL
jgi:hypothetical protein